MNNSEIDSIIARNPVLFTHFVGVFASDDLPSPQFMKKTSLPCFMIVNTDVRSKPGKHWICFLFNQNFVCEYFDSYGLHLEFYSTSWRSYLFSFCSSIISNNRTVQDLFSNTCGEHAISFAHLRLTGWSYRKILTEFYSDYSCKNDSKVIQYVSKLAQIKLKTVLSQPIQVCQAQHYLKWWN